jgi:hypothetical protein
MARALTAETGVGELGTAVVGAAGFATLGDALRAELPGALARELGVGKVALAADAVTAYVGALGPRPGAVLAAGTGLIAIGTDLRGWRRADGWGHLLGDCGSGAWIGRAGLEAALRAYDGRDGGSAPLLASAKELFGAMPRLPGLVYPRADRPAVLASFAPEVAAVPRTTRSPRASCARRPGTWPSRPRPCARRRVSPKWRSRVQAGGRPPRPSARGVGEQAAAGASGARRGRPAARLGTDRHRPRGRSAHPAE